ncbi:MAG TPA: hypothetical protein VKM35_12520 [Arenimonas sp.]|uniref:hypothetical protein n=1 Tax=Arenimonas sp. TaxID=1872635 RepID=UPI002B8CD8B3|nr:hypothetical protein [Arenimonas sp.]HMB58016.1 hypothetical protein [Arenimonas sp.]
MFRPALAFALVFAVVAPAHAGPKEDLHAAFTKFLALTSFRGAVTSTFGGRPNTSAIEFQAPDSYRVTSAGRPPGVIVNGTMYFDMGGKTVKVPMGKETIAQYRNASMLAEIEKTLVVEDLGMDLIGGLPAHKYRYTVGQPHPSTSTIWIGSGNGLPVQLQTARTLMGKPSSTTIKYDHFNDPSIKIVAPKS